MFDTAATTLDVDAVIGSIATSTGKAIVAVRANALQLITVTAGRSLQAQQIYAAPPNSHFFIVADSTGHPAIALPSGFTSAGLPCSVQLVGTPSRTEALLRVAVTCEPYITRRPSPRSGRLGG